MSEGQPLSTEQVEQITQFWTTTNDTCRDDLLDFVPIFAWPCNNDCIQAGMLIVKSRDLPDMKKNKAIAYILTILKQYPFQLWPELAMPMWHRFLDVYNDTGDMRKAMRVI